MAETTEATEAAARVSEVEALFKIHGVDQRSSELLYAHPALGGDASPVRLRQDGSDSAAFVPGTSTVIWPCAYSLGDFLCDATAAVRASDDPRSPRVFFFLLARSARATPRRVSRVRPGRLGRLAPRQTRHGRENARVRRSTPRARRVARFPHPPTRAPALRFAGSALLNRL